MLRKQVHILVLEAFGPPKPEGTQVAHLNGVRTDNRLENLMWATPKENTAHRWEHGTMQITLDAMWAGRDAYNAAKRGEV